MLGLAGRPAEAQQIPPNDCDRLAGPDIVQADIDTAAAVPACEQAVRDHPGETRFLFQYARALHQAGDATAAARLYAWAAGDGRAEAQYALGLMQFTGDGVPVDPASARRWLEAAAAQGYAPAADALANPPPIASSTTSADAADPATLAAALEALAAVLDEVRRDAPRARFDPLAALQPAGVEVAALTDWVGREVALVPYRGSLRGPRGTLMDRHGNSLDRALLLADLLAAAGHEVRLARATLDPATAEALLAAYAPPPADPAPALSGDALAAKLTAAAGAEADAVAAALDRSAAEAAALDLAVEQRSVTLTADLAAIVGAPPPVDMRAAAVTALRDHWWVQARAGDAWVDADPSAAVVGTRAAEATVAPAELPAALRHRVTLRLVVEFWDNGVLREEPLLAHALVPAELVDRPVVLRHLPLSAPPAAALLAEGGDPLATALAAAADAWVWQPVLTVGDEPFVESLFTTRGEVLPASPETLNSLGLVEGAFGDVGGVFDDTFLELGGDPEQARPTAPDEAAASVRVSAEWLEVEIAVPGAAPVVHRRTVFDLVGPAARASGAVPAPDLGPAARLQRALGLTREVDILVAGATPAASFVREAAARDGAALLRAVAPLVGVPDAELATLQPPTVPRLQFVLSRFAALRFAAAPAWLDRPNVVLSWDGFAGTGPDDLRVTRLFDIVANDAGFPAASGAGAGDFAARLAQGVRDTVLEDALAGPGASGNAAALHAADRAAGTEWIRLDPAAAQALDSLALPADARALIARDLAAGALVVAPPAPVDTAAGPQVAWWRIDPRTGTTLGMNPLGGAVMTENAALLGQGVQAGACFVALGMAIRGGMGGAAAGTAMCVAGSVTSAVAIVDGAGLAALLAASAALGGVTFTATQI